jgi:hypothetical protein
VSPLRYLALTVVGMLGTAAASVPWWQEFSAMVLAHEDDTEPIPWRERRRLLPWIVLVVLFGTGAIIGLIGILEYLLRTVF